MAATPPEAMPALCADCKSQNVPTASPWFDHVWQLYSLQLAGYPFGKNELSIDEWFAIAEMKAALQDMVFDG
jgi:hypothetical protein